MGVPLDPNSPINPYYMAAWIGLLVTSLNLMPVGQLDGGHISYAVLGRKSLIVTLLTVAALIGLTFVSMSWRCWRTRTRQPGAQPEVPATVNDPDDPLWVGPCGPDPIRCGWGDFQDVVVSNDGDIWSVEVDLCADKKNECNRSETIIGRLVGGPRL